MPLLFVPTMMAPIVVGLVWKIMLAGSWGLVSYNVLERFGILSDTSVFASPDLALYALIFIDVWQWTPFMMLAFFSGLQALPLNPFRAAAVDGASADPDLLPAHAADDDAAACRHRAPARDRRLQGVRQLLHPDRRRARPSDGNAEHPRLQDDFEFWNIGEASALAVLVWIAFFVFCNLFYQTREEPAEGILKVSG